MIRTRGVSHTVGRLAAIVVLALAVSSVSAQPTITIKKGTQTAFRSDMVYQSTVAVPGPGVANLLPAISSNLQPTDVIDAISFGNDPVCCANSSVMMSVATGAFGVSGSAVYMEANFNNGAGGDVFSASPLTGSTNAQVHDAPHLGLAAKVGINKLSQDDLSGLENDLATVTEMEYPIFFSLAPGSPFLATSTWSAADILVAEDESTINVYVTAEALGLSGSDDINAIAMDIPPLGGAFPAGSVLFSVSAATAANYSGISGADILSKGPKVGATTLSYPYIVYSHTQLGLAATDDVDAFDVSVVGCGNGAQTPPITDRTGDTLLYEFGTQTPPDIVGVTTTVDDDIEVVITTTFNEAITVNTGFDNTARLLVYLDEDNSEETGILPALVTQVGDYGVMNLGAFGGDSLITVNSAASVVDIVPTDGVTPATKTAGVSVSTNSITLRLNLLQWPDEQTIGLFVQVDNRQFRPSDFVPDCGHIETLLPTERDAQLKFSLATMTVSEDDGLLDESIAVIVEYVIGEDVEFDIASRDVTATKGVDFEFTDSAGETIDAGETEVLFDVEILDDAVYTGDRTFEIVLSNVSGIVLGTPSVLEITIVDDESPIQNLQTWDFSDGPQGWADVGFAIFGGAKAGSAWNGSGTGSIDMVSSSTRPVYGVWETRDADITGAGGVGALLQIVARISSNLAAPAANCEEFRLRANFSTGSQSGLLDVASPLGAVSPSTTPRDYNLFLEQLGNEVGIHIAVDLIGFGPDDPATVLNIDNVELNSIHSDAVSVVDANIAEYDFTAGAGTWIPTTITLFAAQPNFYDTNGKLSIESTAGAAGGLFGFWHDPIVHLLANGQDTLYRLTYTLSSDQTDISLVPTIRLRVNTASGMSHLMQLDSIGAIQLSPGTTPSDYRVYFEAPAEADGEYLDVNMDMLQNPGTIDALDATINLEHLLVEQLSIN